ncbi:DUF6350 family protein [Curtobacterium flaccumfaciens]|nr:DUF6350 family protein [Curtobacterium flaccumfaciens]
MNRLGTALLAAIEAVVTVGVGIGIALVPLTLLWGFEYGLQVDWDVFWKATGSVWLVGHGVDVSFLLGSALAKSTGVSGAADPIHVTLAALGFAVVTAWLGARAGRRFAETEHRTTGLLVGTAVVAVLGLAVALSTTSAATHPTLWQAVVLPALWFGIPAFAASEVCRRRRDMPADAVTQRVIDLVDRVPAVWRSVAGFGLRAGTAATAVVVGVAAGDGRPAALHLVRRGHHPVRAVARRGHRWCRAHRRTARLPAGLRRVGHLVADRPQVRHRHRVERVPRSPRPWARSPACRSSARCRPLGTPSGSSGSWCPSSPGSRSAAPMRPRLVRALGAADSALHRAFGGVAAGLVAGVLTGLIAWVSSGSFGPGRLADVGPNALAVGGFAALEVGLPAIIALAAGSDLVRLPEGGWRRERWTEADEADEADEDHDTARAGADLGEGSLLAALDQAGAGRTTDVHRFVVEESHDGSTAARPRATTEHATTEHTTGPIGSEVVGDEPADATPARPAREPGPASRTHASTPRTACRRHRPRRRGSPTGRRPTRWPPTASPPSPNRCDAVPDEQPWAACATVWPARPRGPGTRRCPARSRDRLRRRAAAARPRAAHGHRPPRQRRRACPPTPSPRSRGAPRSSSPAGTTWTRPPRRTASTSPTTPGRPHRSGSSSPARRSGTSPTRSPRTNCPGGDSRRTTGNSARRRRASR